MGSTAEHQNLIKEFSRDLPKEIPEARFFGRHVGRFLSVRYYLDLIKFKTSIDKWPRYLVHINKKGMFDGYLIVDMGEFQLHIELEFKTGKAVLSKEQLIWQGFIRQKNGKAIIIRDVRKGLKEIKDYVDVIKTIVYK